MKAVVTGSAGFIGSHLVASLRADGWEVIGIDQADPNAPKRIQDVVQPWMGFIWGADVVYHLASPVGPVGVLDWAGRLVSEVIETSRIVAQWAIYNGCPLVDVSTSEVYGAGGEERETDDCHFAPEPSARKEYAIAKLAAETMLQNIAGLDVRIVRPFNVAGPGQKADGGFVIPRFIEQARAGEPLTVYAPGTQRRAFTHVADIVDGIRAAYGHGKAGEVYNLCNPANTCTIIELADRVDAAVNGPRFAPNVRIVEPQTLHGPAFREAREKFGNADKAYHELHWSPRHDLATIIADALA